MKRILSNIKKKPIYVALMVLTLLLYFLNNLFFKKVTTGGLNIFMVGYFNDLICPFFFLSYCNTLLLSVGKEIKKLKWLLVFSFCAGVVWEFVAPIFKKTSVTDVFDLICYLLGTFFYWLVLMIYQKCTCKGRDNDTFGKNQ